MPTLSKAERLYRQRTVSALFARGRRVRISSGAYMLKVYALLCNGAELDESASCVKAMFSAPKSSFKHAVDRNRMKRLMRESFRARKADWTGLTELGGAACGASSADGVVGTRPVASAESTAGSSAAAVCGETVLLIAFIFTKIGKPAEGFVLKQADMQAYLDKALDKLYRVWSDEQRSAIKAGRTLSGQPGGRTLSNPAQTNPALTDQTSSNQTESSHGEE